MVTFNERPVWPGTGGRWLLVWLFRSRCDGERIFSHPLLFWPHDEVTFDFTGPSLEVAEREDRRVDLLRFFVEILPGDQG